MLEKVQDWMFFGIGGLWLIVGAVLFVRALWADRSRGRRRCPRCWYDMRGTPGMRCSECGHEARRERHFYRTRRRWSLITCSALLGLLGVASNLTPMLRRDGWPSVLPLEVLLRLSPPAGEEYVWDQKARTVNAVPICAEIENRNVESRLSPRQWQYIVVNKAIRTRKRWPNSIPFAASMNIPAWLGSGCEIRAHLHSNSQLSISAGSIKEPLFGCGTGMQMIPRADYQSISLNAHHNDHLEFDCTIKRVPLIKTVKANQFIADYKHPQTLYKGPIRLPVQFVSTVDEAILPLDSGPLRAALRRSIKFQFWSGQREKTTDKILITINRSADPNLSNLGLGFELELSHEGNVVETCQITLRCGGSIRINGSKPYRGGCELKSRLPKARDSGHWVLKLRGKGELALYDWDAEQYWAGELSYALADIMN